jgi:transcriptional regulator with XRE-family HTH domain
MPPHGATPDHKRRQQITSLRAAGLTFRVIGERLGITRQTAYALSYRRRVSRGEVHCKACDGPISASRDEKANRPVYCLACLAKRSEATFGERVKAYRVAAGLSRAELAKRAGVKKTLLDLYERSNASGDPRWSQVRRLALVLGIASWDWTEWRTESRESVFPRPSQGHTTRRGKPWNPMQVARVLERGASVK